MESVSCTLYENEKNVEKYYDVILCHRESLISKFQKISTSAYSEVYPLHF